MVYDATFDVGTTQTTDITILTPTNICFLTYLVIGEEISPLDC